MTLIKIITTSKEISLLINGVEKYYATPERVQVGTIGGGSKIKWFIVNVDKKKQVGNISTGYTKREAAAKMKKFAAKGN